MSFVSIFLMNYQKQDDSTQKITLKWVIAIILVVVANASLVIISRIQFEVFGDTYKNEFMVIALAGATVFLLLLGVIFERKRFRSTIKYGILYGAGAGIFNAANNLLALITYNYLPISFTSPVRAGLGMVLSFLMSVILYKEKFNARQVVSAVIGIGAVVLMSL